MKKILISYLTMIPIFAFTTDDLPNPGWPLSGWPNGVYDDNHNNVEPGANGPSGGWSDHGTLCSGYVSSSKGPTVPSDFDEEIKLLIQELDKPISPPA